MQTTQQAHTAPAECRFGRYSLPDRPAPKSGFPYKKLFLFGLIAATVAGTVVGTTMLLNTRATDTRGAAYRQEPNTDGPRVVGFGHVDVDGKPVEIYPLQPGRVEEVHVKENQIVGVAAPMDGQNLFTQIAAAADRASGEARGVKKDGKDVLFRMNTRQAVSQMNAAKAALAVADAQLKQAEDQKKQHAELIVQQTAAVAAKKAELTKAQAMHDRAKQIENLSNKHDVAIAAALVEEATQSIKAAEAKLRGLEALNVQLDIDRAAGDVQAKKELVEQARIALDECFVVAPGNGTILRLMVNKGDVLGPTARQPAILFCPSGKRIIRAEVEQEWAARVQDGQRVLVQDDARLSGEWRGTVRSISDWYSHRRSILLEPRQFNDVRTLEVLVELDDDQGLRIGQRVRVIFGK